MKFYRDFYWPQLVCKAGEKKTVPVRRLILAMSSNTAYLDTNRTNPFQLNGINVYGNGLPIAGTPVSTVVNKRIYYNTLEALAFVLTKVMESVGQIITICFNMAFDLTSIQEASNCFTHPEWNKCTISVELNLKALLGKNVELFFMGERATKVYVRSDRKIATNTPMN